MTTASVQAPPPPMPSPSHPQHHLLRASDLPVRPEDLDWSEAETEPTAPQRPAERWHLRLLCAAAVVLVLTLQAALLLGIVTLTACAGSSQDEQRQTEWPKVEYTPGEQSPGFVHEGGRCDRHEPGIPNGSVHHPPEPAEPEGGAK